MDRLEILLPPGRRMSQQNRNDKVQLLFNPTTKLCPRFEGKKINSASALTGKTLVCESRLWERREEFSEDRTSGRPGPRDSAGHTDCSVVTVPALLSAVCSVSQAGPLSRISPRPSPSGISDSSFSLSDGPVTSSKL